MIRYQVILECDYCHNVEIDEYDPPINFDPVEWGWLESKDQDKSYHQFCCEGHMTAYLDVQAVKVI